MRLHFEGRLELHQRAFDERIDVLEARLADRLEPFPSSRRGRTGRDAADDFFLISFEAMRTTLGDLARTEAGTLALRPNSFVTRSFGGSAEPPGSTSMVFWTGRAL
jgi:hypothetical protein